MKKGLKPVSDIVNSPEAAGGFSLIEVIVVIAIFSVGILGAMSMQTAAVNTNASTRKSNLAIEYAKDTMERLMRIDSDADELDPGTGKTRGDNIAEDDYYDGIFDLSWDVAEIDCDGDGTDDAKRIDITVTWDNGQKHIDLSNVRTEVF